MRRLMQRIALATLAVAAWRASSSSALSNTSTAVFNSGGSGSGSVAGGIIPTINQSRIEVQQVSTVSGIPLWVDPETPADRQTYVSSRGDIWELVMSDEFGNPSRNFTPGMDHLWTSLEKPDGVNGALEFYSHNMSYIKCETAASANLSTSTNSSAVCYLTIEVRDEPSTIRVYNMYSRPPSFQYAKFWYRAAMLQSWNKFCFQGGMLEVRSQLPAAVGAKAKNPDVAKGPFGRAEASAYYPTWPGIWMMGNLGRAIFSGSTNRMWPYSYNECNPKAFDPKSQRINACNSNPGHGLNPNQGRGAPEIDLLEGGGVAISSSIQIGPGLKPKYRRVPANTSIPGDYESCYYSAACSTVGANLPNVPTAVYKKRKYQTWYKGLRYSSNGYCSSSVNDTQTFAEINASLTLGLQENKCTVRTCPGSNDVQSDLNFIDGKKTNKRWGINSKGTCFAIMNNYMGSYLCDPDSTDKMCEKPRNATTPKTNVMDPFNYQMDALSANWGIHVGAYTGFVTYQVEWVMGSTGYIRWMIEGNPIFEIPAQSVVNGPQDKSDPNPQLTFPEEPMYIIFNVALSNQWGARPPNADNPKTKKCRGDGKDPVANRICDSFPMYMKIDYIRLYQDRSANSSMGIGCDPATHPTRQWILDHLDEYEDNDNLFIEVDGRAPCRNDDDCMVPLNRTFRFNTGRCNELKQCECLTRYWGGPRCTTLLQFNDPIEEAKNKRSFGPPLYLTITVGSIAIVLTCLIIGFCTRRRRRQAVEHQQKLEKMKAQMGDIEKSTLLSSDLDDIELSRYANSTPQSKYKNIAGKGA